MKVLITGGAGYLGSHCNLYFSERGVETVVLDDLSTGNAKAVIRGRFAEGDYGDRVLLDELMAEEKFDGILHFAASANIPESLIHPARCYENNVIKMKNLLDMAVKHGIKGIVFSSSAATYGDASKIPVEEEDPKIPINPYGTSKLIGEMLLADYNAEYGLPYCAFRYFNAAGANRDALLGETDVTGHIVPLLLRAMINKKPLTVFGGDYPTRDGTCLRDYVHVEDLVVAHYLGLERLLGGGASDCYNLGSNTGATILELIRTAEEISGSSVPYSVAGRRAGDAPVLIASNAKAKAVLGWNPSRSDVKTILSDAYNWELNRKF